MRIRGIVSVNNRESLFRHTRGFLLCFCIFLGVVFFLVFEKAWSWIGLLILPGYVLIKRLFFQKIILSEGDVVSLSGLPGSGKSCLMSKIAYDNRSNKAFDSFYCNEHFTSNVLMDYKISKPQLGKFNLHNVVYFADEFSLGGFDSRNYASNFTSDQLSFFKYVRHFHNAIVYSNQGSDETDKKIRQYLTNKFYFCKKGFFGFYGVAYQLIPDEFLDEHGMPDYGYRYPTFWERLLCSGTQVYYRYSKYGKLYDTYALPCTLPEPRFPKLVHTTDTASCSASDGI